MMQCFLFFVFVLMQKHEQLATCNHEDFNKKIFVWPKSHFHFPGQMHFFPFSFTNEGRNGDKTD